MTSQDTVNRLLAHFSEALRINPPLSLNPTGVCAFDYGDEISISIEVPEQSTQLYLIGTVCARPPEQGAQLLELYERLLKLNLFSSELRGASVAIDPHTDDMLLCYQHPVTALDETAFYNLLTQFTQTVEALRVKLGQPATAAPISEPAALDSARFFSQRA